MFILHILETIPLWVTFWHILSPVPLVVFHFVDGFPCCVEAFKFNWGCLVFFFLLFLLLDQKIGVPVMAQWVKDPVLP